MSDRIPQIDSRLAQIEIEKKATQSEQLLILLAQERLALTNERISLTSPAPATQPVQNMSPDSKMVMKKMQLQLDGLTKFVQQSAIPTSAIVAERHTTYANLYKNSTPQISNLRCPSYVNWSSFSSVPNEFFSQTQSSVRRGDKENVLQKFGNSQFSQYEQSMHLKHQDTHKVPFFVNGDQPDNVFCPKNFAPNQMVAVFALAWKKYPAQRSITGFDSEGKGQAISYGQLILDAQKWRSHVLVCIADLDWLQCFEVKRQNGAEIVYEYQTVAFHEIGRNILWAIITSTPTESLGFVIERPIGWPPQLQLTPIACGGTSIVYRVDSSTITNDCSVVKVYRQQFLTSMATEAAIYRKFLNPPPSIGALENQGENYVSMKSYGRMLSMFHPAACYCDVVRALKYAHGLGITHNDVRSPNILVDDSGAAVLIDWGMGAGSQDRRDHINDLISLVRLFVTNKYFHGFPSSEYNNEDSLPAFLLPLFHAANACDYDALLGLLSTRV